MNARCEPHASLKQTDEPILPRLREDLGLSQGGPGEDGARTWLLYDPLQNKYFKLGERAFFMLSAWRPGEPLGSWLEFLQSKHPSIEQEEAEHLITFLTIQGLTVASTPQAQKRLEMQCARKRQGWIKGLFTHYLYIKIPLVRPDRFLSATLAYVAPFYHPAFTKIVTVLGGVGILLIMRQWEAFKASVLHFFNLQGVILFGVTLFFVKGIHELGHGYTAKRHGCRVPSMGVAFLVLYPFLYTDTTDAWRLTSKKQRLSIVTAGVKTELALACLASFAWSFLDQGPLKSMAFFVSTTSWISSLTINLSPFMRFDGYYALADMLGAENLQQRAFALAKWRMRETLFGLGEPPPEALIKSRQRIFLVYAYSTWIYRFVLFLGIALLVYHLAFKALGVVLFFVEIIYFIIMPIVRELMFWWKKREHLSINRHVAVTLCMVLLAVTFLVIPWQQHVILPAVLESEKKTDIFPHENAKLSAIHVAEGNLVQKGDLLFELSYPELEKALLMTERRIAYLKTRIDRHIGSISDLDQFEILQQQLAKAKTGLEGIEVRMQRGMIRSPQQGQVTRMIKGHVGEWISRDELLARIVGKNRVRMTAYVPEDELWRIQKEAPATFYATSGDITSVRAKVVEIDETAVSILPHPETASAHGGSIPVRQLKNHTLRPEKGVYKVILAVDTQPGDIPWRIPGSVRIKAPGQSLASHFVRFALSVVIRESGM